MSGGGGGSSGQVQYPQYIQTFHGSLLDASGTVLIDYNHTLATKLKHALDNNPFTGVTAYDPTTELVFITTAEADLKSAVSGFVPITNYNSAFAAALALLTLDSSSLDAATVDTTTLSTAAVDTATLGTTTLQTATPDTAPTKDVAPVAITYSPTNLIAPVAGPAVVYDAESSDIDETAFQEDIATYAAILRTDVENNILPRYKAGMLNVNAITTSAFVIGEALIWAEYDRNVARYAAELRSKYNSDNNAFNVQFKIKAQELTAQENLAVRTQTTQYTVTTNELNNQRYLAAEQHTAQQAIAVRDENKSYALAFRDENRIYKVAASEQNSRHKLAFSGETKDLNIAYSQQTTQLKLAASDQNARFKLANTDETTKLKLAASEQNMRFKLQKAEIDASFKINRWRNAVVVSAEITRMMINAVEFRRIVSDTTVKSRAAVITAHSESDQEQIKIDEDEARWSLEMYQYASNLLASVSGGTGVNQKRVSKAVSGLSGALSGAATGAAIGSAFPGYGTAIGAAAGAVIGGIGGYLQ